MIEERLKRAMEAAAASIPVDPVDPSVIRAAKRRALVFATAMIVGTTTIVASVGWSLTRSDPARVDPPPIQSSETPTPIETPPPTSDVETPLEDQAAVFAIRTVAFAGLLDANGYFYRFDSIGKSEGGWRISFAGSRCGMWEEPEGTVRTCKPLSGEDERGNATPDSWLGVALSEGTWAVRKVEGAFPPEKVSELRSTIAGQYQEEPRWEFPSVSLLSGGDGGLAEDGGIEVLASMFWVGPIPYNGPGTICELIGFNDAGEVAYRGEPRYNPAPNDELQRGGGLTGTGIPGDLGISEARYECSAFRADGWVPTSVELEGQQSASTQVIVRAQLRWDDQAVAGMKSVCEAKVLDGEGQVIGDASEVILFWPPQVLKNGPPYENELVLTVRVGEPARAAEAEVKCKIR